MEKVTQQISVNRDEECFEKVIDEETDRESRGDAMGRVNKVEECMYGVGLGRKDEIWLLALTTHQWRHGHAQVRLTWNS